MIESGEKQPVVGLVALTEKVVVTSGFTDTVLPVYAPGDHDQLSVEASTPTEFASNVTDEPEQTAEALEATEVITGLAFTVTLTKVLLRQAPAD
jgi:hypothetical protein